MKKLLKGLKEAQTPQVMDGLTPAPREHIDRVIGDVENTVVSMVDQTMSCVRGFVTCDELLKALRILKDLLKDILPRTDVLEQIFPRSWEQREVDRMDRMSKLLNKADDIKDARVPTEQKRKNFDEIKDNIEELLKAVEAILGPGPYGIIYNFPDRGSPILWPRQSERGSPSDGDGVELLEELDEFGDDDGICISLPQSPFLCREDSSREQRKCVLWKWGDQYVLADKNPLRWSRWLTIQEAIGDLSKHEDILRPVMLQAWKKDSTIAACDVIEVLEQYRDNPTKTKYRLSFTWMWSDGGFLDAFKQTNPVRWSGWKNLDDTKQDLQLHLERESKYRPGQSVRIQVCGEKLLGNVQFAIDFLTEVQAIYMQ